MSNCVTNVLLVNTGTKETVREYLSNASSARSGCLARWTQIEFQIIAENNNIENRLGSRITVRSRILIGLVG
jgi:hypothetical protein